MMLPDHHEADGLLPAIEEDHRALLEGMGAICFELAAAYARERELIARLERIETALFGDADPCDRARSEGADEVDPKTHGANETSSA